MRPPPVAAIRTGSIAGDAPVSTAGEAKFESRPVLQRQSPIAAIPPKSRVARQRRRGRDSGAYTGRQGALHPDRMRRPVRVRCVPPAARGKRRKPLVDLYFKADSRERPATRGHGQAVRHGNLTPGYGGSNPSVPASPHGLLQESCQSVKGSAPLAGAAPYAPDATDPARDRAGALGGQDQLPSTAKEWMGLRCKE